MKAPSSSTRLLLCLLLLPLFWAVRAVDNGQYDRAADLLDAERKNPVSVMLDPTPFNQLSAAHAYYLQNAHVHPSELFDWLRGQIPALAGCYAADPSIPPLFHLAPILAALPEVPSFDHPTPIFFLLLACLPFSPPKNVPLLDPTAPPGPTVDFVRAFQLLLADLAPGIRLIAYDVFTVCITPALEARAQRRHRQAAGRPTERMYAVARMLIDMLLHGLAAYEVIDITAISLMSAYAKDFALLNPRTRNIDLVSLGVWSEFFQGPCQQSCHPRVIVASHFVALRSMCILREALYLELAFPGRLPAAAIYERFAGYLGIELDILPNIVNALGLQLDNVEASIMATSHAIVDFVRANGNGRYGGDGGPLRYRGFEPGRGCGTAKARPPKVGVSLPESVGSDEEFVSATSDPGLMRDWLDAIGYDWVYDISNSDLLDVFKSSWGMLRVAARLKALADPAVDEKLTCIEVLEMPGAVEALGAALANDGHKAAIVQAVLAVFVVLEAARDGNGESSQEGAVPPSSASDSAAPLEARSSLWNSLASSTSMEHGDFPSDTNENVQQAGDCAVGEIDLLASSNLVANGASEEQHDNDSPERTVSGHAVVSAAHEAMSDLSDLTSDESEEESAMAGSDADANPEGSDVEMGDEAATAAEDSAEDKTRKAEAEEQSDEEGVSSEATNRTAPPPKRTKRSNDFAGHSARIDILEMVSAACLARRRSDMVAAARQPTHEYLTLVCIWTDKILELVPRVRSYKVPLDANSIRKGKPKAIQRSGIGRWVAHHDPPTWESAFHTMRVRLVPNPSYGSQQQRAAVEAFLTRSKWKRAGMPVANFHNPGARKEPAVSDEERLAWICLLDSGALHFVPA